MLFSKITAACLGLIVTSVTALPPLTFARFTGTPLELFNLSLNRVESANATLTFSIHDPDPLANTTTICTGSWPYGSSAWPKDSYQSCGDNSFAWNMASYDNWTSFTLGLEHVFTDPR